VTAVQGSGTIGKVSIDTPVFIRYGQMTHDEVFITHDRARDGYTVSNTGSEPLVMLRYFGPDTNPNSPKIGSYVRN
jgi:hypothetical protein